MNRSSAGEINPNSAAENQVPPGMQEGRVPETRQILQLPTDTDVNCVMKLYL